MDMIAILVSLLCAGFALLRVYLFKHSEQRHPKVPKQAPPVARPALSASPKPEILVAKSYRCGLERTGADMRSTSAIGDAIFAPARVAEPAMQGWNTLVVQPPIGEDGELAEPEAPADARPSLPALPAKAELRDAEVHAMLGELDFGECAVMGDTTAEERQAIANFDIRAYA